MVAKLKQFAALPAQNLHVSTKGVLAGAVPVLFLLLIGAVAIVTMAPVQRTQNWVDHTDIVITQAGDVMRAAVDLETGVCGYLPSPIPPFLAPFHSGDARLHGAVGPFDGGLRQYGKSGKTRGGPDHSARMEDQGG
ncbi:MAG: CHASE3 domain-containing protein [Rhodobacteraceae bacterium]|nr:CHASE3 domain-containing protein [Paracoccaceae bacterium]